MKTKGWPEHEWDHECTAELSTALSTRVEPTERDLGPIHPVTPVPGWGLRALCKEGTYKDCVLGKLVSQTNILLVNRYFKWAYSIQLGCICHFLREFMVSLVEWGKTRPSLGSNAEGEGMLKEIQNFDGRSLILSPLISLCRSLSAFNFSNSQGFLNHVRNPIHCQ